MPDKPIQVTEAQSLITGMPKYCSTMTFILDGTTYTTPVVVGMCTDLVSAASATSQAKAAYHEAVANEHKLQATNGPVISFVRQNLAAAYGTSPTTLEGLGVAAKKKRAPLSPIVLAASAAKAEATRKARGTTSKKQKQKVVGNVSGVVVTPVVSAPVAPAPAPVTSPVTATAVTGGTLTHT